MALAVALTALRGGHGRRRQVVAHRGRREQLAGEGLERHRARRAVFAADGPRRSEDPGGVAGALVGTERGGDRPISALGLDRVDGPLEWPVPELLGPVLAEELPGLAADAPAPWTADALVALLTRLDDEAPVQAKAIRLAARSGGRVTREQVYELGGFPDDRMLRGFTRPPVRLTAALQAEGVVPDHVLPIFVARYPDGVKASYFSVPPEIPALHAELPVPQVGPAQATDVEPRPG